MNEDTKRVTAPRLRRAWTGSLRPWIGPLLLVAAALVLAGCAPEDVPGMQGDVPLRPAEPDNPLGFIAWLLTPVFQVMFIILVAVYVFLENLGIPGAIGIAIVVLTLVVRTALIPLFRRQLVSQRRMQMLQPELGEIKRRFKGDTMKQRVAQQELMKERGINPLAGCLPILLQLPLLFIIYRVIVDGLLNYDPTAMLTVGGIQLVPLDCPTVPPPPGTIDPCINTTVPFLGDVSRPQISLTIFGFPLSLLAFASALVQLVQSRMMLMPADPKNDDPNVRIQRQMMLFLPLISILYGGILPAGLFIYWIVATLYSIVQQYLIVGWGAMFPFLGWNPAFAQGHTPRFPVAMPPPVDPSRRAPGSALGGPAESRAVSASKTIRQRERGRQGRRGRRR
jgi:YidC/Oxa1 family membrane protein insertase